MLLLGFEVRSNLCSARTLQSPGRTSKRWPTCATSSMRVSTSGTGDAFDPGADQSSTPSLPFCAAQRASRGRADGAATRRWSRWNPPHARPQRSRRGLFAIPHASSNGPLRQGCQRVPTRTMGRRRLERHHWLGLPAIQWRAPDLSR